MKVTLLIAVCTLVLMLQQMQTPMAKPQGPTLDPLHDPRACESFLLLTDIDATEHDVPCFTTCFSACRLYIL